MHIAKYIETINMCISFEIEILFLGMYYKEKVQMYEKHKMKNIHEELQYRCALFCGEIFM